jgi:hypothetical protein
MREPHWTVRDNHVRRIRLAVFFCFIVAIVLVAAVLFVLVLVKYTDGAG